MAENEGKRVKKIADETQVVVEDALRSIASNIGDIFAQALQSGQNAAKTLGKDVTSSINSLAKSTDYLVKAQEKANRGALTYRDVTKEIQERNAKIQAIKNQIEIAERSGIGNAKQLKKELASIESYNKEVADSMAEQLNYSKKIEKSLGLTGSLVSGIGKLAGKMGFDGMADTLAEANDRAAAMAKSMVDANGKAAGFGGKLKILASTAGFLGKALLKNLFDPLTLATGAVGLLKKALSTGFGLIKKGLEFLSPKYLIGQAKQSMEAFKELSTQVSGEIQGMARNLGLTQGAANALYGAVAGLGPTAGASASSIESIYNAMGSTEKLSQKTLDRFVKLNVYAGYSAESLASMQKYAKILGQDAGTVVDEFNNQIASQIKSQNLAVSQKVAFESVAKVSNNIKMALGGSSSAIVSAVLSSKKLGLELEDALDSAKGFLNLEESIASEQELRLLTGQDIDLTKARELAATRDFAGLNKEIARVTKQIGGDAQNNQFIMDAITKTLGVSEDKVASILNAQKEQTTVQGDLNSSLQEGADIRKGAATFAESEENRQRGILAQQSKSGSVFFDFAKKVEHFTLKIRGKFMEIFGDKFSAWWKDKKTQESFEKFENIVLKMMDKLFDKSSAIGQYFSTIFDPQITENLVNGFDKITQDGGILSNIFNKTLGKDGEVTKTIRDIKAVFGQGELTQPESFLGKIFSFIAEFKNSSLFKTMQEGFEAGRKAVLMIVKMFDGLLQNPMFKTLLTSFIAGAAVKKTLNFMFPGLGKMFEKGTYLNPQVVTVKNMPMGGMGGGMPGMSAGAGTMMYGAAGGSGAGPTTRGGKPDMRYKSNRMQTPQAKGGFLSRMGSKMRGGRGRGLAGMAGTLAIGLGMEGLSGMFSGGEEEQQPQQDLTQDIAKQKLAEAKAKRKQDEEAIKSLVDAEAKIMNDSKTGEIQMTVRGKTYTGKTLAEVRAKAQAGVIQSALGDDKTTKQAQSQAKKELEKKKKDQQKQESGFGSSLMSMAGMGASFLNPFALGSFGGKEAAEAGGKNVAKSAGKSGGKAAAKSGGKAMAKTAAKSGGGIMGFLGDVGKGIGDFAGKAWKGTKNLVGKGAGAVKDVWNWGSKKISNWFAKNVKPLFPKLLKSAKGPVGKFMSKVFGKIPILGALIEALFAGQDINAIMKDSGLSRGEAESQIGKTIISSGLGLLGGSLAAAGVSSLQAVGIPGWLLSTAAYAGGDFLGRSLGSAISDFVGGPSLGKLILNTFGDDMVSRPGYGKRTLFGPEGAVQLNDKDTVIAGTNLFGDDVVSAPKGSVGLGNAEVVAELRALRAVMTQLLSREGAVYLDGNKVGAALVKGSYRLK